MYSVCGNVARGLNHVEVESGLGRPGAELEPPQALKKTKKRPAGCEVG